MGVNVNSIKIKKLLLNNGYYPVRQNGSHIVYKNNSGHIIVIKNNLNRMIMKRLEKEINNNGDD